VLSGLDVFNDNSTLQVFDKFGNLIYQQVSNKEFKWDGKIQSRSLNTDAYWFVISAGDQRVYKGWILLKNRN
jgi:gliding motility-associated-like protein